MKRYKELKYNKKTYTEQYKIDEILLKENFGWFLDCEVEDVRLEITHSTLIFNSGTFFNGTWKYGVFRDGVWKYGVWEGGVWYNGKWFNGAFQAGIIFNGKFFHGKMESGEIKGGEFYHMEIDKSVKRPEEAKKPEPEDNTVPQGEKITTEKMTRNIKSFSEFTKLNEDKFMNPQTKEEMWQRLAEIDDKLENMERDSDEATILSGEYDELSAKLDGIETLEEQPGETDDEDFSYDTRHREINPQNEPEIGPEPDLPKKPEQSPQSRFEEWKRLSTNAGSRRVFKTMDDYLRHTHGDKYRPEE